MVNHSEQKHKHFAITSSDASILAFNNKRHITKRIIKKMNKTKGISDETKLVEAMIWGIFYEGIARSIIINVCLNSSKIRDKWGKNAIHISKDFYIQNKNIGTSPDGVILFNGIYVLIEIKCPYTRIINDTIPIYYIHQVQHHLLATGLNNCMYIEFKFKEFYSHGQFISYIKSESSQIACGAILIKENKLYSTKAFFSSEKLDQHLYNILKPNDTQYTVRFFWIAVKYYVQVQHPDAQWLIMYRKRLATSMSIYQNLIKESQKM